MLTDCKTPTKLKAFSRRAFVRGLGQAGLGPGGMAYPAGKGSIEKDFGSPSSSGRGAGGEGTTDGWRHPGKSQ